MFHTSPDYYEILNVSPGFTNAELKKEYIKLCKEFHPDVNNSKGAENRFKLVQEAYDTLSCPHKRAHFDTLRDSNHVDYQGGGVGGSFVRSPPKQRRQHRYMNKFEAVLARRGLWLLLALTPVFGLTYLGLSTFKPQNRYEYDPPGDKKVLAFYDSKMQKWLKPDIYNIDRNGRSKKMQWVPESQVSQD